jgi:hypothetical protein
VEEPPAAAQPGGISTNSGDPAEAGLAASRHGMLCMGHRLLVSSSAGFLQHDLSIRDIGYFIVNKKENCHA